MKYSEVIELLARNVITHFDEVYHGVEIMVNDSNKKIPALASGDEWVDLAPTDEKEIIYIRRAGDDEVDKINQVGSCAIAYSMRTPLRIVFFRDHESCPDAIVARLLKIALTSHTRLRAIIRDKFKLLKEESSIEYDLGASTAYFAIDLYAMWHLLPDVCEESDLCVSIENPLCKQ